MQTRTSAVAVSAVAVLCALSWMSLNVAGNYGGNISGLLYTGSGSPLPAEMAAHTWRVQDKVGYDAQYYHLIAHDPLNQRGFSAFIDNPPLRWRRIGVPAIAAILAAGNDRLVDWTYVTIQLLFVFLGSFWLARYAQRNKWPAAWGLAFLAIPAVAVSIDRMTVDLALAALTVGLVYYTTQERWSPVYLILCAAPLVRETGMVVLGAWCLHAAWKHEWRPAVLGAACALPALGWWIWVGSHTSPDGTPWLSTYPFSGLIERTVEGAGAPVSTLWLRAAWIFEETANAGIWLAMVLSLYLLWKRRCGLLEITAVAFTAFAAALGKFDIWESAYAAGRTMSPLLIVLGLIALRDRKSAYALPLLLVLPRIALQYEAQFVAALKGLL